MGQLAFSNSFGMLEEEKWHHAISLLRKGLELVGPFTPVPWLTRIAFDVPILPTVRNFVKMEEWCARRMDERISVCSFQPIFHTRGKLTANSIPLDTESGPRLAGQSCS